MKNKKKKLVLYFEGEYITVIKETQKVLKALLNSKTLRGIKTNI